jgi:hypothetical protein
MAVETLSTIDDRYVGAWKQNLTKSHYQGPSVSSPSILEISRVGEAEEWCAQGTDAEGKPFRFGYTALFDGKLYPVEGVPFFSDVALRLVDHNTVEGIWWKNEKIVRIDRRLLSDDARTLTYTAKGTLADGKTVVAVMVFEKQQDERVSSDRKS